MTRREAYLLALEQLKSAPRSIVVYDHATGPRVILMAAPRDRIEIALPADVDRFALLDRVQHDIDGKPWSLADYQARCEAADEQGKGAA